MNDSTADLDHGVYVIPDDGAMIGAPLGDDEGQRITTALCYAHLHHPRLFTDHVLPVLLGGLQAIARGPHGAASQHAAKALREARDMVVL